ncbi:hypothetical protein [Bacterioplanoides sp.]|uniref:hypothetical protein n=1 Tax=Bacterioplanoides sp. TaxID=2066072 RepID=UPI003B59B554
MLDVHIDDFYKDCAVVLLQGFRQFPRAQTLFVEDISGPDDVDEFGLHSPRHQSAFGAVIWLKDEGFIRFSEMDGQKSVDEFVLTSKSFSRLLKPDPRNEGATILDAIEYARLQGDSILLGHVLRDHFLFL